MTRLYRLFYGMFLLIVSILLIMIHLLVISPVVQSVASPIADPGVTNSIPAQSHTFVEINHEIFSTDIFLLLIIQERLLSVTSESMCM